MRKLRHFHILGANVGEVLDEFNERRGDFRVHEADIVNVQVRSPKGRRIETLRGTEEAQVEVLIFYWAEE